MTRRLPASHISDAVTLLLAGKLVAFPTETVYGLGARADDTTAVGGIFAAKSRPQFNPLIVHVPDLAAANRIAKLNETAERLARSFWPGPLTLVLPLREQTTLSPLITAGQSSVAVRVPSHPIALDLLRAVDVPLAAPSANPSGKISATTADHVIEGLGGRIDAVLDGGPCDVGLESTIIQADPLSLLRPGGIPPEKIEAVLSQPLAMPKLSGQSPIAPGQLNSHYAPDCSVRLNARFRLAGEVFIGFGAQPDATFNLSEDADLDEAAANLFAILHLANAAALRQSAKAIAVAPIPAHGPGIAINDRLKRAAAPRSGVSAIGR
ncbi:MAG: L-threonylcarbamoyladenylate synthase [Pseudomonadota bacterium]